VNTSELRAAWSPACNGADMVTLELHGEGRVTVDRRMVDAVGALDACLIAWNYRTRAADTGAYNCRQITGGTGYSLHAYGIALDLNWQTNPYGPTLITDMPAGMVDDVCAIRTNNGARVWEWGGSWSGNKDAMHYEADCSPADLATGIAGATEPEPELEIGAPTMFVAIDGVALAAVIGSVVLQFADLAAYGEAKNSSPNVPAMVIPGSVPLADRQHIWNQMIRQHLVAVGEDPTP